MNSIYSVLFEQYIVQRLHVNVQILTFTLYSVHCSLPLARPSLQACSADLLPAPPSAACAGTLPGYLAHPLRQGPCLHPQHRLGQADDRLQQLTTYLLKQRLNCYKSIIWFQMYHPMSNGLKSVFTRGIFQLFSHKRYKHGFFFRGYGIFQGPMEKGGLLIPLWTQGAPHVQ